MCGKGVGLRLAVVKACVETCKGTVSAANLKPKGFVVTIILKSYFSFLYSLKL